MSSIETHWVITKSENATKPTSDLVRHPNFEKARKEAERLAAQEKKSFSVYQLVGVAKPIVVTPVEWTTVGE